MQECNQISEQIISYTSSKGPSSEALDDLDGDGDITNDVRAQNEEQLSSNGDQIGDEEILAAIVQQNQSWLDLGYKAAALVDLSVYTLLYLAIEDSVYDLPTHCIPQSAFAIGYKLTYAFLKLEAFDAKNVSVCILLLQFACLPQTFECNDC
jgi:hypothetical protein